jgi:Fe-S-cluster containining protein
MASSPQESVLVEFTLAVGEGKMAMSAQVPSGPTNLTQILPVIRSLDDSLISSVISQVEANGLSVSCRAGCAACCRQMIPLTIFEAEALAAWIHTLPEARQQLLAQRFHLALQKLSAAGLIDRMIAADWLVDSPATQQLSLDYLYQHVDCPFLEEERCSIHAMRPLVCREYMVVSPREHCSDPARFQTVALPLPIRLSHALSSVGTQVEGDSRGWIPLLFLFAWMKSGAHPGDAVSDIGPRVLQRFLQHIPRELHSPHSSEDTSDAQ